MQILPQQVTRAVRFVERIGEFSDAAIGPRGRFVDVGGGLHVENFMGTLVVEFMNEGIELSLLLKEIGTGGTGSFHFLGSMHAVVVDTLLRVVRAAAYA